MPQFSYKAKNGPHDLINGVIEADTVREAVAKLIDEGRVPVDLKPFERSRTILRADGKKTSSDIRVQPAVLFQFTRQLADLLEAGIPLSRCMDLLSRQKIFVIMSDIIKSMTVWLQQGASLSFSLAKYPNIFSPLYIHTVKAAETSGQVPLVLHRLAQFLENDMQTRSKIKSSLLYPGIIFAVGLLTLFVLLSFVLPRLTLMFQDFNAKLPLATRMVVAVSQLFGHFWWLIAGVVGGLLIWVRFHWQTEKFKLWIDRFSLKVPLLKSFIENTQMSRFSKTLGMLLESGVPIVTALESVAMVIDNRALQEEVQKMSLKVLSGMSLTQAIKASQLFPEMAVDLIAVGQESGKLEKGLYKLAENCERSSQASANTFVVVLGPAVLVIVVGMVGFMIVAMLLPMFQINTIVN
jgi:type II secretory pathway component PulF